MMRPRKRKVQSPLTGGSTFSVSITPKGKRLSIKPSTRTKRALPGPTAKKRARIGSPALSSDSNSEVESDGHGPIQSLTIDISNMNLGTSKSQPDYMRSWMLNYKQYLAIMLEGEAIPNKLKCLLCGKRPITFRCLECIGPSYLCTACCESAHHSHPFHRIERWRGSSFEPSWLWSTGVVIHLGHNGAACPSQSPTDHRGNAVPLPYTPPDEDVTYGASPPGSRTLNGNPIIIIVHINGIHHLPISECKCVGADPFAFQLLRAGLYPSTEERPRSVFTFQLLDYYLTEILESRTPTHSFYAKLRRLTNEPFPGSVPDRYRELLRVGRQWRHLKELASFGFASSPGHPQAGELALFCAACPQPGINLPRGWQDDSRKWLFTRGLVMDGNFKSIHRMQKTAMRDVYLKAGGEGYMTAPGPYQEHIASTVEKKERSHCYDHRAIADREKPHKGCDMNVDYAVTQALRYGPISQAPSILLLYDIACQYSKNVLKRMTAGNHLLRPDELSKISWGIGTWHVHGHKEECMVRYSPSFIPGAGMTSGEILESLWSTLNEVGRATSVMTLPHRMEVLDSNMMDSNWKKMLGLVPYLSKNLIQSRKEADNARGDFDTLSKAASAEQITEWSAQMDDAVKGREKNVSSMDIFNVATTKRKTRKGTQATLMSDEQVSGGQTIGATKWIALGLDIQEQQLSTLLLVRRFGKLPTEAQGLEIETRRERLARRVKEFYKIADLLFPLLNVSELETMSPPYPHCTCDDEECSHSGETSNPLFEDEGLPEYVQLALPSTVKDRPTNWKSVAKKERELRGAQAFDCLEKIRLEVGHKTFLFRANIQLAYGKKERLRGYSAVASSNRAINYLRAVYRQCRWALTELGGSERLLQELRPLAPTDVKAIVRLYDNSVRNQRNSPPPWIWALKLEGDPNSQRYLEELHRVNWFRARARMMRWDEEHTLISEEMGWVLNYFRYQAKKSLSWASGEEQSPSAAAWSHRRSEMWKRLGSHAEASFKDARHRLDMYMASVGSRDESEHSADSES
ncbi:hypothetical protein D9611_000333 [Ephemerocybe angulata]|uniref:CxC2-like cysteine cluster KDZ transposase-associated domain-containing protein n=1 Tax=Ephemerocybe angulata TaxID=980116 RepID=A0A8H5F6S4_9AGAR|nr:hypothetical protein D9611_000333 [Tulosesus angulatus]